MHNVYNKRSKVKIILQPLGAISLKDILWLKERISKKFPFEVDILVNVWKYQIPLSLYDWYKMQYVADETAIWLAQKYSKIIVPLRVLVLGLSNSDGFVRGLNFVFGVALPSKAVALVFTKRLVTGNSNLYRNRLLKESLHELGHLLGLSHCSNPYCVMSFSNTLDDVDRKNSNFCEKCLRKLRSNVERINKS